MIVLDTHVVIWASTSVRSLGRETSRLIARASANATLNYSAVSIYETHSLRGRLRLPVSIEDMRRYWREAGLIELPLTGEITLRATQLTGLNGDPFDRFIAATAEVIGGTLVTADEDILAWPGKLKRQDARL